MENAITAALSKQIALARALDVAANNVANQTTAGFKAELTRFSEFIAPIPGAESGDDDVALVLDRATYTDFSAGGLEATGSPLDFAIDGDGFFAALDGGAVRYTRDGRFALNAFGELSTREGALVLDDTGAPILIDPELGPVILAADGELQQDGVAIARLAVSTFENRGALRRVGGNLFETAEAPQIARLARIRQGFVEQSNVEPIRAMTDMVDILRAYEGAAEILETANDLARSAVRTLSEDA